MVGRKKRKSDTRALESVKRNYYTVAKPGAFTSVKKAKIFNARDRKKVAEKFGEWLRQQPTHKRFTQPVKVKTQSRIISPRIGYFWDADLMDMQSLSAYNKGNRYVLICIDIFSRKIYAESILTKGANDVVKAFEIIFNKATPLNLRTDAGKEFTAIKTQELFKQHGVKHFVAYNQGKSSYAERSILNIKRRLTKYMFHKKTYKWYDVLQDVIQSYNKTLHSSIGTEPDNVNDKNTEDIAHYQYDRVTKKALNEGLKREQLRLHGEKFKAGDYVRLSTVRSPFAKDYDTKWTDEVFKISKKSVRDGIPIYHIVDMKDETVKGSFYAKELQKSPPESNTYFEVEKIIKTRTVNGEVQHFVKFKNHPPKFNDWVLAKNVKDLK